ncbi:MAG: dephospho-CoA kinase [Eubacterium sp.]|nr:dephospho-CoA kinase [Eubacterium sp.]
MKIIGITGGIGSGKSVVLNMLHDVYGARIVEADKVAHELQKPGQPIYNKIVDTFGNDILDENDSIDRIKLGKLVMNDESKLDQLNSIVHPGVKKYILEDIEKCRNNSTELYVIEAALLIQGGYKKICDEMWYIKADESTRISRLIESRGYTEERALQVIKNQPDETFYIENSDRIIDNSGTVEKLEDELKKIKN